MSKPEFVYVTYIATTPEKLWQALTSREFTQQFWFSPGNPKPHRLDSDWQVGSPIRLYNGDQLGVSGEVLEYDPPKRLVYTFVAGGMATASRVCFTLEPVGGSVQLTLVHDLVASQEMANSVGKSWASILSNLKSVLETGKALQFA